MTDAHLLIWHFEDWLKKYFFSILQILETLSLDSLTYVRTQTLAFLTTLLRSQPEQEQNLLRLLVNKLVRPQLLPTYISSSTHHFRETPKSQHAPAPPTISSKFSKRIQL